ncbi:hypothetical protein WME98_18500 [Sorangium sp. So ce296]|uniref:hypothetical protein n=1 Tax=Sorangium sp. So ce296 TaxID=3133296 RepID=UPI003F5EE8E9
MTGSARSESRRSTSTWRVPTCGVVLSAPSKGILPAPDRGRDGALLAARHALYQRARRRTPWRWTGQTRNWTRIGTVTLNPHTHEAQALTTM